MLFGFGFRPNNRFFCEDLGLLYTHVRLFNLFHRIEALPHFSLTKKRTYHASEAVSMCPPLVPIDVESRHIYSRKVRIKASWGISLKTSGSTSTSSFGPANDCPVSNLLTLPTKKSDSARPGEYGDRTPTSKSYV
jgi:hypothetical protein